jgi:hypothetical protein
MKHQRRRRRRRHLAIADGIEGHADAESLAYFQNLQVVTKNIFEVQISEPRRSAPPFLSIFGSFV